MRISDWSSDVCSSDLPTRWSRPWLPAEAPLRCAEPWSWLESVLLEEVVKRRAADPEQLGGAGDVVLGAGEGLANGLAVGLLAGRLEVDGKATLLADAEIEVLGGDELAVGHDDRQLHPVLEPADIARPEIGRASGRERVCQDV